MSADAITVCPACYAEALGIPFDQVTIEHLQGTGLLPNELREFHESWIDKGVAYFNFRGRCPCGYDFNVVMTALLPKPEARP